MLSASKRTNFLLGCLTGLFLSIFAAPIWKIGVMASYQDRFGALTYACDSAMLGHFIAKQRVANSPSIENANALKAAEIGLLECQDYDMMRKHLIRWGLSNNDLSEMSLLAVEQKGQDLRDVIRVHEIRY